MKIRVSTSLRAQVEAAARENNRTLNSEIVSRLEASFRDDEGDARSAVAANTLLRSSLHGDPLKKLEERVEELEAKVANLMAGK
nr:hypothetical protein A4A59_05270 [Rhizobium leguminosarum]